MDKFRTDFIKYFLALSITNQKMIKNAHCLTLIAFLSCASCGLSESSEERLESLYRQRIPHSKYVMYNFRYSGPMALSSDYAGTTILDSNVKFSRSQVDELPDFIDGKLKIDGLNMIRITGTLTPPLPDDTLLTPTKTYSKLCNGVDVKIAEYKTTYGSIVGGQLKEYKFDNFKETEDSLIFYDVIRIFGSKELPSVAAFCKGNIRIEDSLNGYIGHIAIKQMVIERGEIYKPTKPFEIVKNQPIVDQAELWFYPKGSLKSSLLTDNGIYKQLK